MTLARMIPDARDQPPPHRSLCTNCGGIAHGHTPQDCGQA